jgi:hypothetical protein
MVLPAKLYLTFLDFSQIGWLLQAPAEAVFGATLGSYQQDFPDLNAPEKLL